MIVVVNSKNMSFKKQLNAKGSQMILRTTSCFVPKNSSELSRNSAIEF